MYTAGLAWQTRNLVEWMKEETFTRDLTEKVDEVDWAQVDMDKLSKQQLAEWESIFARFFLTKRKRELFPKAIEKGTMVFPLYEASDLLQDPQLEARGFWIRAEHPELKAALTYPGIPAKSSEVSFKFRPPPLIGEHNQEIYEEVENIPKENLKRKSDFIDNIFWSYIEPIKNYAMERKTVPTGRAYIQSTFNNTVVTLTDPQGNALAWGSSGTAGFKGSRKGTPYAAQMAARDAARKAMTHGLRQVEVYIKGPGSGREAAIRSLQGSGLYITGIRDVTPIPHAGCRPPKRRRV